MADTEAELQTKLKCWKECMEAKGLKVNASKTKVMISTGEHNLEASNKVNFPCGVCKKAVGSNSIQCISSGSWVHKCAAVVSRENSQTLMQPLSANSVEMGRLNSKLFNLSLFNNSIPSIWKLAKIISILKPNKDPNQGTSYRPISLLSPIAKTLEKSILPYITLNIPQIEHQHGFKQKHSTTTAIHEITENIIQGFNEKRPPSRTVMVSLDMSKAFDTINIHTLIHKIHNTKIPATIQKFTANYIKGRKASCTFQDTTSSTTKQKHIKTGVPQGGVLSPILFNIYMSDIPEPPQNIKLYSYADDINTLTSHSNINTAQDNIQPYLKTLHDWTAQNHLILTQTNPPQHFLPQTLQNTTLNYTSKSTTSQYQL